MLKLQNQYRFGFIFVIISLGIAVTISDAFAESDTSEIIVQTVDSSGEIFGYYTILSQGGVIQETSFSAATFTVNNEETYNIEVQDFENFEFVKWQDTGSAINNRDIAVSSNAEYFAEYENIIDSSPAEDTSEIIVHTVDSSGEIFGYYTILSQGGVIQETSFSAATFTVNNEETYNIEVQDFENFEFVKWQDTGSAINNRDIAVSSNAEYFAEYENIIDSSPAEDTSEIVVRTANSSGREITGYWTVLLQEGVVVQTGFSPEGFIVNNGETYEVIVGDWAGMNFHRWDNGNSVNLRTFSITSDTTFIAFYNEDTQ